MLPACRRRHLVAGVPHPFLVIVDLPQRLLLESLQLQKLFVLWQVSQLHRYGLLILRRAQSKKKARDRMGESRGERRT